MKKILLLNSFIISVLSFSQEIEYSVGDYNFFENKGQWPGHVLYKADVTGGKIWLEQGRVLYHWEDYSDLFISHGNPNHHNDGSEVGAGRQDIIAASFIGCNENVVTEKKFPTKYYQNYFLSNDRSRWASDVHGYNHVKYKDLYNQIDLLFYEKAGHLKYEFEVAAGGDPSQIQLEYAGHQKIKLDKDGNLKVESTMGAVWDKKPYAYQIKNGKIIQIDCDFKIEDNIVTYELGKYDKKLKLIIDPDLIFATYCGSTSDNFGMTATFAYDGKGYSAGMVYGPNYPCPVFAPGAWNCATTMTIDVPGSATTDVFVSKYNETGTDMLWTNFIGGGDNTQGCETVHSLICDTDDNIYLYGATSSIDFPTFSSAGSAYQTTHAGGVGVPTFNVDFNGVKFLAQGTDIWLAKISADGTNLLGSTYVGGTGNDGVNYDPASLPYNAVGFYDDLIKNYGDQFRGEIMLDSINNVIIASSTRSTDFPTVGAFQGASGGGQDAVLFKISADFSSMQFSSYYGGSNDDAGFSVKVDSSQNVVFAGGTMSADLPNTVGGVQPAFGGGIVDGYVAKVTMDGSTMVQSTYVGTNSYDNTFFVEIDRWDNIYIVGQSEGAMPVSGGVYSEAGGSQYIWKLNPSLTGTLYTTIFGSGDGDIDISPSAFLVDFCGNVYVSGWGANILQSVGLTTMTTTSDAYQTTSPNGFDFYMIVLTNDATALEYATYMGGDISKEHVDGGTSRFDKYGIVYQAVCGGCINGDTGIGPNSDFPTTAGAWSDSNLSNNCNALLYKFDFEIVPTAQFTVDTLEGCAPLTINITNGSTEVDSIEWFFGAGVTVITPGENPTILIDSAGIYEITLAITDTICNLTDSAKQIITVHPPLDWIVPPDTIVCGTPGPITFTVDTYGDATAVTWGSDLTFTPPLNTPGVDSSITFTPTESGTYYVTATNGFAYCDLLDSVQVIFVDGAINAQPDTIICWGTEGNLTVYNELPPGVTVTYDWEPDQYIVGPDNGTSITVNPTTTTTFYVTATTSLGCTVTDSVVVGVFGLDPSTISATANPTSVPENGTTTLTALPPGYSYTWTPPEGLSNPNAQITQATVSETTTWEVEITDGLCDYRTQVTVEALEFICGDVYIFVPNAFTPDGNNENDILQVLGQNIEEMNFKIFDRWGEKVFESTDQSFGWDGVFRGKVVDPDVYVYHLKVTCAGGDENLIKGNITVLR